MNKSELQELCHCKGWSFPQYNTTQQGPPHIPLFSSTVHVHGLTFSSDHHSFKSKKEAENSAAGLALKYLADLPETKAGDFSRPSIQTRLISSFPKSSGLRCVKVRDKQIVDESSYAEKRKVGDEFGFRLAEGQKLWEIDKHHLQPKDIELEKMLEIKKNELEDYHKKLQQMNETATIEKKAAHVWESLLAEQRNLSEGKMHHFELQIYELKAMIDVKNNELEKCHKQLQQMNDTATTEKRKAVEELESLLSEARKIWQIETQKLEKENFQLKDVIDVKTNKLEQCQKQLQQMKETAGKEKRKAAHELESLLAEEKKLWQRENQKLQVKNTELETMVDEKKAELEECQKQLHQMNETPIREKKAADELVESLLAEERKVWQRENYKLQMENTELQNVILAKKNELEDCQKQLENNMIEIEKLQQKDVHLEDHIQVKQATDEILEARKKIDEIKLALKDRDEELSSQVETCNALIAKERSSNDELQKARKELISGLTACSNRLSNIGVKILGELDLKAFQVETKRKRKYSEEEANKNAAMLCSMWESNIGDPKWNPFKNIKSEEGKLQVIIDEEDKKLMKLKSELGNEAYLAVTTALLELNEHNSSGRYKIRELWNFREGRKASLAEAIAYVLNQWKLHKKKKKGLYIA